LVVCVGWYVYVAEELILVTANSKFRMHILAPSFLDPLSAEEIPIINLHPRFLGYTMV
jgi:hypothetical protein